MQAEGVGADVALQMDGLQTGEVAQPGPVELDHMGKA
jgi:hypothetical protein